MKLNNIEDKLLKKALDYEILVPVSDNDTFDIRIFKRSISRDSQFNLH